MDNMRRGWVLCIGCMLAVLAVGVVEGVLLSENGTRRTPTDDATVNETLTRGSSVSASARITREFSRARDHFDFLLGQNLGLRETLRRVSRLFQADEGVLEDVLRRQGVGDTMRAYPPQVVSVDIPDSPRGYLVEFAGPPVVARQKMSVGEAGASGGPASMTSYRKGLSRMQEDAVREIEEVAPVKVRRTYRNVFNGVSVDGTRADMLRIMRLPYVKAVYPIKEYHALLYDSVPQIQADRVWSLNDSMGRNITGVNVTVAVIDTGVDYTHPDFGGCGGPSTSIVGNAVNYTLESQHPYEDDLNESWIITKGGFTEIAAHFEKIDVESGYDYVYVEYPNGTVFQSFTGVRDNFWSRSIPGDSVRIRLESDEMVTDWGFKVDRVLNGSVESEWNCSKFAGGYDFVNYDEDPMDDQGHGTHVAGIVAAKGNVTGVAPDAQIVAYKVLDSGGSGTDEDIIAAIEMVVDPNQDGDTRDHWDIISMSLGGSGDPFDAMSQAVDNAVDAGVVVVVAAGNSGPDAGTVDSPGCARKAITVGAAHKVNQSQGERNSSLLVSSEENLMLPSLALRFSNTTASTGLVRKLAYGGLGYPQNFSGVNVSENIVLMQRGEITFREKVGNAYAAGAAGALIYNNFPGNFYGTLENDSAIPAAALSQENGTYLKNLLSNKTVEVNLTVWEHFLAIAEFSSRGPVYIYQKPDVVAPGVLICSTRWDDAFSDSGTPCLDGNHVAISGTSMATPHVAGAAALLLQAHPEWSPLQVKAALEDTAHDLGLPLNDEGAGLIDAYAAVQLTRAPPIAYISNLSNMEYV